jgi:type ISP restriction-modification system protein/carboxypeptidase family protein
MRKLPSALLAAILFACPAVAQAVYGNVYGTITDQSGALIAGARITILDVAKGNLVQTASNAFGNYMVTHLAPGDYNVRGQAPGFKSKTVLQVRVFADQGARVDLQFEIGVPTESVSVSAEDLPLLKTDRADVATTFTDREVVELPLFDRNFTDDLRWLYWEPETKLLDEKREEFIAQVTNSRLWLEIRQREASDKFCRGTLNRCLSDQLGNGMSHFVPNTVFPKDSLYTALGSEQLNLSDEIASIATERGMDRQDLFFYTLATLHTPRYRSDNAGALLGDWPRIPVPATAELLSGSATLGRRLAELLDAEAPINLGSEWSFLAALKLPRSSGLEDALKLTAGWGYRGQGSTVMPGQGLSPERPWTTAERGKLTTLAATRSVALEDVLSLFGETCSDVHLNGESFWSAIPINVWNYTLGGYQVLKKWLSYRELPLLGRPLHSEEAAYFAQVVRRISALILLGPALDASYNAILPTATGLSIR